jgi:hypothetical protein
MEDLGELVLSDRPHVTVKPALQAKQKNQWRKPTKTHLTVPFA